MVDFKIMPTFDSTPLLGKQNQARAAENTHDCSCFRYFRKAFCSRHIITWLLLTALLGGIGYFLLTYAVPLVDKAHEVADEVLTAYNGALAESSASRKNG